MKCKFKKYNKLKAMRKTERLCNHQPKGKYKKTIRHTITRPKEREKERERERKKNFQQIGSKFRDLG